MKKLITAAVLAVGAIGAISVPSVALASDKLELGYRYDDTRNSSRDQRAVTIDYDHTYKNGFVLGAGVRLIEQDETGNTTNRYLLKAGYNFSGPLYVQGAVGHKQASAGEDTEFWQAEAGVKHNLTKAVQVRLGYVYREGFRSKEDDYYHGPRVAVKYNVTDTVALNVKYDYFTFLNDVKRDRFGLSVEKKF